MKKSKQGFLLIEIMVALAVIAISLGAILQVFSFALKSSMSAKNYQLASYLAEERLWALLWKDSLEPGKNEGPFTQYPDIQWIEEITLVDPLEEDKEEDKKIKGFVQQKNKLYQVLVAIVWNDQGKDKAYELATYQLLPDLQKELF